VTFLPQHKVYWGDFGHVAASLEGLRWVRSRNLDYAILLTGQCYPLVPIGEIEARLGQCGGKSFIQHEAFSLPCRSVLLKQELRRLFSRAPVPSRARLWLKRVIGRYGDTNRTNNIEKKMAPFDWGESGVNRIIYYHIFSRERAIRVPFFTRETPLLLLPYGGESYWCLSRECVDYVLKFVESNPEVVRFFKNTFIPCETFFQTILANSPLRISLINDVVHYLEWEGNSSPNILESSEKALASGKWFARKFESLDVLDEIDRQRNLLREQGKVHQ
jgi:hypothetical protein